MGHIYGTKWALVFGKLVPFFAKFVVEDGRSRDFFYYLILIEFLWISYPILIGFYRNYWVNLLITMSLGFRKWRRGKGIIYNKATDTSFGEGQWVGWKVVS